MSSLYKIFLINIKKEPHKTFIHSFNKTFSGNKCRKEISFLRKFLKKNKIKTLGINYKNSADWIFWYLAADSLDNQILMIKNGTTKDELKKIKSKYNIDFIARKIPNNLNLKVKSKTKSKKKRSDIIFTSGSLDLPKGVVISENAYLHVANILVKRLKQKSSDTELLSMPFDHSFGLVRLRCCILSGTTMLVSDGLKNFPQIYKFSQENNLSGLSLVPSGLALIKILLKNKVKNFISNLRYLEIGSSHLTNDLRIWLKKNFLKTKVIHHYGMTEASRSFLISRGKNDDLKKKNNLIGKMIPGCKYKIDNNSGELMLKGKNLFEKYFDPKNNENKFFDGWFRTGDLVKNKGKNLYIIGRADNQFNIGGNKVQAEMIENLVESISQVKKCLCFTKPDEIYGNSLALTIEKKNLVNKNEILKLIKKKMIKYPDYYNPTKIIFKKILLTKNGKKIRTSHQTF